MLELEFSEPRPPRVSGPQDSDEEKLRKWTARCRRFVFLFGGFLNIENRRLWVSFGPTSGGSGRLWVSGAGLVNSAGEKKKQHRHTNTPAALFFPSGGIVAGAGASAGPRLSISFLNEHLHPFA